MQEFITILVEIILPIFLLISMGTLLHKKFQLDLYTLAKINIYYFVPGITFIKLYQASFSAELFIHVLGFFAIFMISLFILSSLLNKVLKHRKSMRAAFSNSVLFYNSANYGVPVNDLAFTHDPFAMTIQILILTLQNIFTFSYGIIALQSTNGNKLKALLGYIKMPIFYAILLGMLFNIFSITIPNFVLVSINYVAEALVSVSLLTLGAQIANLKLKGLSLSIVWSILARLVIGPIIAFIVVSIFQMEGIMAQALIISSAMPTAVNVAIIAQEYNTEPEFSSQVVVMSTLFSAITVTIVIYMARLLFS